mmetsp:Transcript_40509/g.116452  ORF Transcript_40509/g.116452 Transcript_40509/m.116452 type:complete len:101 (-) Transcript_40509:463-765(-)|eukprot:CAMPEP_0176029792 /NCGR_PEP_ID=MMETSP0120_2-20121206/14645_1 /TAXON_ID=160619 /ORGANISM="Kryptoperidinium foliaceum, Strain CCMP 1326" /LENGTH=100 /DNA_ID=CAMNT_0017363023 /DNA_START=78 /DNA_END=380 /DNA_ORIENTATION=-
MKKNLSGLQREVLGLYRAVLREALKKDRNAEVPGGSATSLLSAWANPKSSSSYARQEFRRQSQTVKRNDFKTIEFKIRAGHKQVKLLKMPGVKVVGKPSK